jgi:hypothetical protein
MSSVRFFMSDLSCLNTSLLMRLKISARGAGGAYRIAVFDLDLVSIYSVSTFDII